MKKLTALAVSALMFAGIAAAGNSEDDFMSAVIRLAGYSSVEELDEDEVERYAALKNSPLPLNFASRSRLLSSGLLSVYQVAVLLDYRELSGDILSLEELSALDGFGYGFVSALRYFITLDSASPPGRSSASGQDVVRHSVTLKSGVRNVGNTLAPQGTYSMKYRLTTGECFDAGIALRSSYQAEHFPPETYSFFAACRGRRIPFSVVAGDYTLRFGQGLALWSGFSMSGASSPDAFSKRPYGISPYNSYSGDGTFRGIAADMTAGRFSFSAFVSGLGLRELMSGEEDGLSGILCGANIGWYGMHGQASVTGYAVADTTPSARETFSASVCSADIRYSLQGLDLFSEAAFDMKTLNPAALAGARGNIGENWRMALLVRYYPAGFSPAYSGAVRSGTRCSNEHGISLAAAHSSGKWIDIAGKTGFGSSEKRFNGNISIDAAYSPEPKYGVDTSSFQVRLLLSETVRISPCFSLSFRFSERYRSYGQPFRSDVRTDFRLNFLKWSLNVRANLLHCEDFSSLAYAEGGYRTDVLSVWLRAGAFFVDNWDDRIYAYERDAPGNFNSPAYYGRGYWVALTSGWKISRSFKLYFRGLFQDYPWLRPSETERKPPKIELKLGYAGYFLPYIETIPVSGRIIFMQTSNGAVLVLTA